MYKGNNNIFILRPILNLNILIKNIIKKRSESLNFTLWDVLIPCHTGIVYTTNIPPVPSSWKI